MMGFICVTAIASCALANRGISVAVALMLCVVLSLIATAVYSIWARRPSLLVLVVLSLVYLTAADGGVVPGAERYLPTELTLERFCKNHTALNSGRKRSKSLTQWASRLCLEDHHGDLQYLTPVSPSVAQHKTQHDPPSDPIDVDALLETLLEPDVANEDDVLRQVSGATVPVPIVRFAPANVVTISRKRDLPQNRAFFISGHCLVVLSVLAMAMVWEGHRSKRLNTRDVSTVD